MPVTASGQSFGLLVRDGAVGQIRTQTLNLARGPAGSEPSTDLGLQPVRMQSASRSAAPVTPRLCSSPAAIPAAAAAAHLPSRSLQLLRLTPLEFGSGDLDSSDFGSRALHGAQNEGAAGPPAQRPQRRCG